MKRPATTTPRRARSTSGAVARSRKEAAIQLVRLEFDLSRVDMAIAQAEQRAETYRAERKALSARRQTLVQMLQDRQETRNG